MSAYIAVNGHDERDAAQFRFFKRALTVSLAIHLVGFLLSGVVSAITFKKPPEIDVPPMEVKFFGTPRKGGAGKPGPKRASAPKPKPKPAPAKPRPEPAKPKPEPAKPKAAAPVEKPKKEVSPVKDTSPKKETKPAKEEKKPAPTPPPPNEPEKPEPEVASIDQQTMNDIEQARKNVSPTPQTGPPDPLDGLTGEGTEGYGEDWSEAVGWIDGDPRAQTYWNTLVGDLNMRWDLPLSVPADQTLHVDAILTIADDGTVLDYQILYQSGNKDFDQSVIDLLEGVKGKQLSGKLPVASKEGKTNFPLRFIPLK